MLICLCSVVMSATRRSYFAVFDGHGGHRCSEFLSNNLHKLLATNSKLRFSPLAALQEAWLLADAEVLADFQRKAHQEKNAQFPHDGSTATVCLIIDNECYIANCGDSAAFVEYSCGHIQKATEDHGTVNPSEVARCIEGGAHFTSQMVPARFSCLPFCPQRVEVGKPRLYPGGLLVTRAFGDFYAKLPIYGGIQTGLIPDHGEIELFQLNKDNSNKKTQPQDSNKSTSATTTSSFSARKVSPKGKTDGGATDPSVITRIILASDGVWDAYSPEDVQRHLAVARTSPQANRQPLPANDQNTGFPSFTALGSLDDEDVDLKHLARSLCTFAINSPIWGLQGMLFMSLTMRLKYCLSIQF
jgi:serine/threonine protein phosphatase PrpC